MKTKFVSQMLVLVVVALVACVTVTKADTNKIVVMASSGGYQSSWTLMEMRNQKTWKNLELALNQPRLLQKKVAETPVAQSAVSLVVGTNTIAVGREKASMARVKACLGETPKLPGLWSGVNERSYICRGDSMLRIFGIRGESWPLWLQAQYHDSGSVKDDCRTPPETTIAAAASFDFR